MKIPNNLTRITALLCLLGASPLLGSASAQDKQTPVITTPAVATAPAGATALAAVATTPSEIPYAPAQALTLTGVSNFAQVTPLLYRGAQPTKEGFASLKKQGIDIVVNLRGGSGADERRLVTSLGMRYVGIPWSSIHGPDNEKVAEFLELLQANPDKKIFVHCREGRDRTGVMVAAFRMADQHWSSQQALNEMAAFHFHSFWFRSWKAYVESFLQQFSTGAAFQPVRAAAK